MQKRVDLEISYEVQDLGKTIDFYHILLGDHAADIYPGHAQYKMKNLAITLVFKHNPACNQLARGDFNLQFHTDEDVYKRFSQFISSEFVREVRINKQSFGANNHSFSVTDPNGICWHISVIEQKVHTFKLFNLPRMNSMWDILKPI